METIIEELIRIEASARTIVEEALAQKERLGDLIAQTKEKIVREAGARAEAEIETARRKSHKETEEQLLRINESSRKWIKSLEDQYAQNHAAWEAEIFSAVLAR